MMLLQAFLGLISRVHLASFLTMLPKQLKYSTFSVVFGVYNILRCGPGSSVGIATDYGLDGPGIESR